MLHWLLRHPSEFLQPQPQETKAWLTPLVSLHLTDNSSFKMLHLNSLEVRRDKSQPLIDEGWFWHNQNITSNTEICGITLVHPSIPNKWQIQRVLYKFPCLCKSRMMVTQAQFEQLRKKIHKMESIPFVMFAMFTLDKFEI